MLMTVMMWMMMLMLKLMAIEMLVTLKVMEYEHWHYDLLMCWPHSSTFDCIAHLLIDSSAIVPEIVRLLSSIVPESGYDIARSDNCLQTNQESNYFHLPTTVSVLTC